MCISISESYYCKQFTNYNVQVMTRSSWSRVKTVLRRLSHQSPKIYFHQTTSEWAIFYIFTTSSIVITYIQSLLVVIVVFWRYFDNIYKCHFSCCITYWNSDDWYILVKVNVRRTCTNGSICTFIIKIFPLGTRNSFKTIFRWELAFTVSPATRVLTTTSLSEVLIRRSRTFPSNIRFADYKMVFKRNSALIEQTLQINIHYNSQFK